MMSEKDPTLDVDVSSMHASVSNQSASYKSYFAYQPCYRASGRDLQLDSRSLIRRRDEQRIVVSDVNLRWKIRTWIAGRCCVIDEGVGPAHDSWFEEAANIGRVGDQARQIGDTTVELTVRVLSSTV